MSRHAHNLLKINFSLARRQWAGMLGKTNLEALRVLTDRYGLSVALGDVRLLDYRWYVTHAGLLRLARRNLCSGIWVQLVRGLCDAIASRWVFKATVYTSLRSK